MGTGIGLEIYDSEHGIYEVGEINISAENNKSETSYGCQQMGWGRGWGRRGGAMGVWEKVWEKVDTAGHSSRRAPVVLNQSVPRMNGQISD